MTINKYRVTIYLDNGYNAIFEENDTGGLVSDVGHTTSSLTTEKKTERSHSSISLDNKDYIFSKMLYRYNLIGKRIVLEEWLNQIPQGYDWYEIFSGSISSYTLTKQKLTLNINT